MSNFDREWILFGPGTGYSVPDVAVEGLYFIYCEAPESVKIGVSSKPLNRLANLGTGSPSQLHLVFYSKLLGRNAESTLHQLLSNHQIKGEWFDWSENVQGFALGVIFAISGVIQVSWPFSSECDKAMFIKGVDWAHEFLDPENRWTLESISGMGGESAFEFFQVWSNAALSRASRKNDRSE